MLLRLPGSLKRKLGIIALFLAGLVPPPALPHQSENSEKSDPFRRELWASIAPTYRAILKHPFLRELQAGTLQREKFNFYLLQDLYYLRAFSRALELAAAKAPRGEWADLLRRHARESIDAESRMHETILRDYGVAADRIRDSAPSPTTFAYCNFLLASAHSYSFPEILAALAPCYWIYLEVGRELKKRGSRDRIYQQWIDTYSSPGYEKDVEDFLAVLDAAALAAGAEERARMRRHFERSSRYEWMFWDMAYRLEKWPPQ